MGGSATLLSASHNRGPQPDELGPHGVMADGDDTEAGQIELIRAALFRFVESESLRRAAREVGMSPTGVSNFLYGSRPGGRTRTKLLAWYEAHQKK